MSQSHDAWDWATFQRTYWGLLVNHARRWLAICPLQSIDPEDVAQETMLRAWKAHDKGAEVPHPRAWLLKIQTNVFLTFKARTQWKPQSSLDELGLDPQWKGDDPADGDSGVRGRIDPFHWLAPHADSLPGSAGLLLRLGLKTGCWDAGCIAGEYARETGTQRTVGGVRSALDKARVALLESFGWGSWLTALRDFDRPLDDLDAELGELITRSPALFWKRRHEQLENAMFDQDCWLQKTYPELYFDYPWLKKRHPELYFDSGRPKGELSCQVFRLWYLRDVRLVALVNTGGFAVRFPESYSEEQAFQATLRSYDRLMQDYRSYDNLGPYESIVGKRLAYIEQQRNALQQL